MQNKIKKKMYKSTKESNRVNADGNCVKVLMKKKTNNRGDIIATQIT